MDLVRITEMDHDAVESILREEWGDPLVATRGRLVDASKLPGFLYVEGKRIIGLVTYEIVGTACEIVTLNSFHEGCGIGKGLVDAVVREAAKQGCDRVWLITTNDNIHAIRFYQRHGFGLSAAHIGAVDAARMQKPAIPLIGMHEIPIHHELEFTRTL